MEKIKVSEIAAAIGAYASGEAVIDEVCIDSRQVAPGCLFVAIAGENFDGHDFVDAAVKAGAAAIVSHKDIECAVPVIRVDNTSAALMKIAAFYRMKFPRLHAVGLTGSVGKTTTKDMVHCVLSQKYKTLKNEGNRNNEIGMPLTVLKLDSSYEAAVFEMGMYFFGEISALTRVARPDVGIITNIGVSHIENLGSQENILKAKLELIDGMRPGSPLLLNGDDKFLRSAIISGFAVDYYGIENKDCRFRAEDIRQGQTSTEFVICFDGQKQAVTLPAIGIHHVYDALAAFAAGIVSGVSPQAAADGLNHYMPSGMRQNVVNKNGVTVIEDCYNASPDSMRAALGVLADIPVKRRVAVLGDMNNLGGISQQAHEEIGKFAVEKADMLLAVGKKAQDYIKGAQSAGGTAVYFEDKEELASYLAENLCEGDGVLFKASRGMKLEEVIMSLYERWNEQ